MRYPTRRSGLVIPPQELGFITPTVEQLSTRGVTNIHHHYYERARYHGVRFHSVFRNLITNTSPMLNLEHARLHREFDAPRRPRDDVMIEVVEDYLTMNGVIHCIKEKHTRSCFEIQADQWQAIKRGYRSVNNRK